MWQQWLSESDCDIEEGAKPPPKIADDTKKSRSPPQSPVKSQSQSPVKSPPQSPPPKSPHPPSNAAKDSSSESADESSTIKEKKIEVRESKQFGIFLFS